MKRFYNLVPKIADMDNLRLAFVKAKRGKQDAYAVVAFQYDLENNLLKLQHQILSGNLVVGKYHTFQIYDPKERTICAADFAERVLHHAIMNICSPIFDRHLIFSSYATRVGKGQYSAIAKARKALKRYDFVLKLDIRKYFDSISHNILKQKLSRLFKDAQLLMVFAQIIDSYSHTDGYGLPIGNLTSQFFANYYLSDFDHYVKEQLCVPVYIRYMDDMLFFADSKFSLLKILELIAGELKGIELESKPPVISSSIHGVNFLGYRISRNKILLSRRSKIRFARKYSAYCAKLNGGQWDQSQYQHHVTPLFSYVKYAYSRRFCLKIINRLKIDGL